MSVGTPEQLCMGWYSSSPYSEEIACDKVIAPLVLAPVELFYEL